MLSVRAANFQYIVTGRSRDEVDEALNGVPLKAFALLAPAEEWQRHGGRHPMGDDFGGFQDVVPQVLDERTVLSYASEVPESLLRSCLLNGTPDVRAASLSARSTPRQAIVGMTAFRQPWCRSGGWRIGSTDA